MNEKNIATVARSAAREIYQKLWDEFKKYADIHGMPAARKKCGIDPTLVSRFEERKSYPKLENALKIIYGLDISAIDVISLINKHKELPDVPSGKEEKPQKKHTVVK